ncbi:subtilase-type protease inhibitor [Microbispora sp. NPDC049125]|uniref:subtilase-type protease inhibitor n=1 Tax=Microbispora sp. NPDC049125 TaxID=3154929 RepID=UPI0034660144
MTPLLALLAGTTLAAAGLSAPAGHNGPAGFGDLAGVVSPAQLLGAPVPPAPEAGGGSASRARTVRLAVARGEGTGTPERHVTLTCAPPGGTHPSPAEACRALDKVGGDPARFTPAGGKVCPLIYDPVTVTASGIWDGKHIWYQHTFGNNCEMQSYGPFFAI